MENKYDQNCSSNDTKVSMLENRVDVLQDQMDNLLASVGYTLKAMKDLKEQVDLLTMKEIKDELGIQTFGGGK